MKKFNIKLQTIKSKNNNDCWANAISRMTKESYDIVFNRFKDMQFSNGGLDERILEGYFITKSYDLYNVGKIDLYDALQLYDNKRGIIFLMEDKSKESHAVYIKDGVIYDTITQDMLWWYIKEYKVTSVITKCLNYE